MHLCPLQENPSGFLLDLPSPIVKIGIRKLIAYVKILLPHIRESGRALHSLPQLVVAVSLVILEHVLKVEMFRIRFHTTFVLKLICSKYLS